MNKKTLYIDMDGVTADFDYAIKELFPNLETGDHFPDYDQRKDMVDHICEANPTIFHTLPPIQDSVDCIKDLSHYFDLYFLSTPMWNIPESFTGKRIWLEEHYGEMATKRLILTHRKDLNIGDFLVDDRIKNGVDKFTGYHIHYGTELFPNWLVTHDYLIKNK
jgi:5'(3')-deoxyribonucleotidase